MKHLFMFCMLSLFICSIQIQAKSTERRYKELQKNAAFRHMSFIEIAAENDDFGAISFFMNRASLDGLLNAYVTLKEKRHQLEVALEKKPAPDIISVANVAESKARFNTELINLIT